ncbi:hypothetical protein L7F22_001287 [Adiantum nelumboides]|nr:hypothetical protein [Adiantum nelumboides]
MGVTAHLPRMEVRAQLDPQWNGDSATPAVPRGAGLTVNGRGRLSPLRAPTNTHPGEVRRADGKVGRSAGRPEATQPSRVYVDASPQCKSKSLAKHVTEVDVKQIFYSIGSNGRCKEEQSEAAPWFDGTSGCGCDGHGSSSGNQATRRRVGIPVPTGRSWLNAVAETQGEESPHAEN